MLALDNELVFLAHVPQAAEELQSILILALDNELVFFLAHVPRAEELLVVLAVKQCCLVTIQSSLTGRTSDEVWEVETDLTRVALTRAADEGKPLGVLEAEVEGQLALGRRDHVGVGQAHL